MEDLIGEWVRRLVENEQWLHDFVETGGSCELYLGLVGRENAGFTISHACVVQLARLGVNLSIEVFPDQE